MNAESRSAFLVAGTQSGSGKTTVALGLMAALVRKGLRVQPFKCGPDFIDPTLHALATGRVSRNLDLWMTGETFTRQSFRRGMAEADVGVIEGVMGMFDGGLSSSASLARTLGVPLVLVLDVRSAAESAAAVLKGFETLDPTAAPSAVILNRVGSERHLSLVAKAITEHCRAEVIGYLPRSLEFAMPSRHLGLHMGEDALAPEALAALARTVVEHIDLDRLLTLAEKAANCGHETIGEKPLSAPRARIAVARDRAFCFYYEDNLELLRAAGAELVFFSPMNDGALPDGIGGIYLGGGYPELYSGELSANIAMRQEIRDWAQAGRPIYAECGGFMYLCRGITVDSGEKKEMAGVFPVAARMCNKRTALGYREIRLLRDTLLGPAGTVLRGHEFHYSEIEEMPVEIPRCYGVGNGQYEGYRYKNVLGGYMHLHFGFRPQAAEAFVAACEERSKKSEIRSRESV
ncbi:MAG: cobyrinate a,c-diamide synthase [Pseudomonadota bacterium]